MSSINMPSFIKDYKTLLFGDGCDSEKAWVAVNKYGRDESTDVERSVGINTWYVQTTTFKLEEGDKQFLTNQGRGSTRKFLQKFLENNDLKKLIEEEMNDIVIQTDISVDIRKLEKIIDL